MSDKPCTSEILCQMLKEPLPESPVKPFFSVDCLPMPRWRELAGSRDVAGKWKFTAAEQQHVQGCKVCSRLKQLHEEEAVAVPAHRTYRVSRRDWLVSAATAALLLVGTYLVVRNHTEPIAGPLEADAWLVNSPGALGPETEPTTARGIAWRPPANLGGYICILEIDSAGSIAVRPDSNIRCIPVEGDRPEAEVVLKGIEFRPSPTGSKTIWILMTDLPAAETLKSGVNATFFGGEGGGQSFPQSVLIHLQKNGYRVLAVGKVNL